MLQHCTHQGTFVQGFSNLFTLSKGDLEETLKHYPDAKRILNAKVPSHPIPDILPSVAFCKPWRHVVMPSVVSYNLWYTVIRDICEKNKKIHFFFLFKCSIGETNMKRAEKIWILPNSRFTQTSKSSYWLNKYGMALYFGCWAVGWSNAKIEH